ncbi:MAG: ketose-bisphosphate aldolase [Candidatus Peregrinibacteria bacterium]
MRVALKPLLDHAAANGYGLVALNINNAEQALAVGMAASETDSPVIVQMSRGARKHMQEIMLKHVLDGMAELWPHVPFCFHQDHGNSPATCFGAIKLGFTSVMMDGSLEEDGKTPASLEYNIRVTRTVVEAAHAVGVSVEGEVGCLGHLITGKGEKEDGHGAEGELTKEQLLTDPFQAEQFVRATGVDALAVAIGTSHGAAKFDSPPTGEVLRIDRAIEIFRRVQISLVMHGSSSVPQELQDRFRAAGGVMKQTWGVPVEQIQRAIREGGVRKVNVDTDCRIAYMAAVREALSAAPGKYDPRHIWEPARNAMYEVCRDRMVQFGQAGQGPSVRKALGY